MRSTYNARAPSRSPRANDGALSRSRKGASIGSGCEAEPGTSKSYQVTMSRAETAIGVNGGRFVTVLKAVLYDQTRFGAWYRLPP